MKKLKRILVCIGVSGLLLGMAAGCSKKEEKAKTNKNQQEAKSKSDSKQKKNQSEEEPDEDANLPYEERLQKYLESLKMENPSQKSSSQLLVNMVTDTKKPELAAGISDYIFVGYVEEDLSDRLQKDGNNNYAREVYKIKVQKNIKGKLKDEVLAYFMSDLQKIETRAPVETGKTYICSVQTTEDGGIQMIPKKGFTALDITYRAQMNGPMFSESEILNDQVYLKYLEACKNPVVPEIYKKMGCESQKSELFDAEFNHPYEDAVKKILETPEAQKPAQATTTGITADYIVDLDNPNIAAAMSDYVFAGEIEDYLGGIPLGDSMGVPYSVFKVKVQSNMQGELKEEVVVKYWGGLNKDGDLTLVDQVFMPEIGKYYIFCAGAGKDGSLSLLQRGGAVELDSNVALSGDSTLTDDMIQNDGVYLKYAEGVKNPEVPEFYKKNNMLEHRKSKLFDASK